MREKFNSFINCSATRTVPSTGTESVGLAAIARGVMVFASPSRLFHRVPGLTILTRTLVPRDYFVMHPDSSAICQDLQKPRHRDTDGNSPNRRAVMCKGSLQNTFISSAQAGVWQLATTIARAAPKHMLSCQVSVDI